MAREQGRRRRRILLGVVCCAALVGSGLALLHSSVLGARNVEVSGSAHAPYATVVKVAGLEGAPPLVDLSAGRIASRVERLPWVEHASVALSWPSTVRTRLTDRVAVAVVSAGAGRVAVVDPTGRVLEMVTTRPSGLPLIVTGRSPPAPGGLVGEPGAVLAKAAATLPESMVPEVTDLRYASKEIVADLSNGLVALLGGPSLLRDKFVALATVLARSNLTGIGTIDLRVPGAPVLIRKSASPIVAQKVSG